MAIVAYARVSTTDQNLDVQRQQLQAVGYDKIFEEKISGAKCDNRPQFQQMMEYVRSGDVVICCKLDRIARSTKDLLEIVDQLQKKEVGFRVLNANIDTTTATGKLILSVLASIAEFERSLMLERQLEGIRIAKEAGRYKGRKPTAQVKAKEVIELAGLGVRKADIARRLKIGVASVYRILGHKALGNGGGDALFNDVTGMVDCESAQK